MTSKTILITGGNSGIGYACAEYIAGQDSQVIITGRNQARLEHVVEKLGPNVSGYVADAGDLGQIDSLVEKLEAQNLTLDGVFLNAGIFKPSPLEEITSAHVDETMNINFKGPLFTIQKLLPLLNNPASIVVNTSIVVFKAFANTSVYTASKAALESIVRVLNLELASRGIRLNIISPGVTQTPILEKSGMEKEAVETLMQSLAESLPLGRVVQPADIAPILAFLFSDASLALRNEKIVVDGGSTM